MIPTVHAGSDFGGLLDYLQKPGHSLLEPLDMPVEQVVEQMKMVAELSARCTKPVKHLTFSAAKEDGRLDDATWLKLVDEAEHELGLEGHLRMVFRHSDKGYDHIHPFWCTVSAATGHVPPKRWFRVANSNYLPELGPCALSESQVDSVPAPHRKLKSYDAHALTRLQHLCRAFERRHGLRQLASPAEAKVARESGAERPRDRQQEHRVQRMGDSLMDKADTIRKALDAPTYDERAALLRDLGFGIRSAMRKLKNGEEEIRGAVIYDLTNDVNALAASKLDLPSRKYGMGALDQRTAAGALQYAEWIKVRDRQITTWRHHRGSTSKGVYEQRRDVHRQSEDLKREDMRAAKKRHAEELRQLRAALMVRRGKDAKALPLTSRRSFYAKFDEDVRVPAMAAAPGRHRAELATFKRARFPSFAQWKRLMLAAIHKLMFPATEIQPQAGTALHRVGTLAAVPSLHKDERGQSSGNPRPRSLIDQAVSISNRSTAVTRTTAKGGTRAHPSASVNARAAAAIIATFEFETPPGDAAPRFVPALGQYRATVQDDGVAYARPGMPVAFVDRGASIDLLLADDSDLHAATTLAFRGERVPLLLHADPAIVDRIRQIIEILKPHSLEAPAASAQALVSGQSPVDGQSRLSVEQAVNQSRLVDDGKASASTTSLARRSVAKGPRTAGLPDDIGIGRKDRRGR